MLSTMKFRFLLTALLFVLISETPSNASVSASVSVNAASPLGVLQPQAFGVNTAVWDGHLLDSSVPSLLQQAGVTFLRYPGGSTSDVYHWQTNSATAGTGQYINPNDTFDNFMSVVNALGGTAVITVNYGSNAAGTGGGDPAEAAAWVQYANVTKGYGVKYWEIGNEIYGNGEYGADWEEDLHADHSPAAYANNGLQFISQMKAVDPTIKVGVVLCAPGNWPDGVSPDWNSNVLSICGQQIDFVIVHWYPQGPGSESDSYLLGCTNQVAGMVSRLKSLINQYCGANASNVQILLTENNSVYSDPGKQSVSQVNALYLADDFMTWLENGATSAIWWDLHNGITLGNASSSLFGSTKYGDYGILSSGECSGSICEPAANTPFRPYYGLKMLSYLGRPGDQMVSTTSSTGLIAAHAVKQANGRLALLLINKDRSNSYTVTVTLSGYTPASKSAAMYTYSKTGSSIAAATRTGISTKFNVAVGPYSLRTLVLGP
ncbi:MAG TPA: hypothetical protein VFA07_09235 [Chthonomonadaceae bacterium]|nr:hypothetical protein [Chthonomonadaceae bacterium]